LDDAEGEPLIVASEPFPSRDTDIATQLHDVAEAVRSRLEGLVVERVVVRRADRPARANNNEGPRLRLLVEGAITSAARSVVVETNIGTGKDIGAWYGSNKSGVNAAASLLLQSQGLDVGYAEATAAALAAMRL